MDKIQMIDMKALKILCKAYDKDPKVDHSGFPYPGAAFYTCCEIRIEAAEKKIEDELVETLAALEHEQWISWSQALCETETISVERLNRWGKLWVPYSKLSESMKDQDRRWARKVVDILNENQKMDKSTVAALIEDIESVTERVKSITLDSREENLNALTIGTLDEVAPVGEEKQKTSPEEVFVDILEKKPEKGVLISRGMKKWVS